MALINVTGRKPKVSTSDGHGMSTAGKRSPSLPDGMQSETGNFMHENEFNRAVEKYLHEELTRCGFEVLALAPTDEDVSLSERVKRTNAWGADFHLDIHANAFNGVLDNIAGGIETFAHFAYPKTVEMAKVIHNFVMRGTEMKNRGVKNGDWLYMCKNTNMPAVLVELGFMDNLYDIKLLLSDAYRRECASELAQAICSIFGMKYVPKPEPKTASEELYYRVITGSFTNRENAVERMEFIKAKTGLDSFLLPYKP